MFLAVLYFSFLRYTPFIAERHLRHEEKVFPYPANFRITEETFARGAYCWVECPSLTVYGVFSKPVTNRQAFLMLADSMKKAGYKGVTTDTPYHSLYFENVTKGSTRINIQVWPEPPVIPGGGDNPSVLPSEVPTQWVKLVFE